MPESSKSEFGIENLIELLVMPAIALFESLDFSGNENGGKVRDSFSGLENIFMFIALPILIPFMEMGKPTPKQKSHDR